jgi:hypothetical protein
LITMLCDEKSTASQYFFLVYAQAQRRLGLLFFFMSILLPFWWDLPPQAI